MAEQRRNYRRFEDRRVAVMLVVYEILFDHPPGKERQELLLKTICDDYQSDGAAILNLTQSDERRFDVSSGFGKWASQTGKLVSNGPGFDQLETLQQSAPGALTFTRVKRPAVFSAGDWDNFWEETLLGTTMALLSVQLTSKNEPAGFIWVLQSNYSREWSSRDRALAEEIASLISRASDRGA